MPARKIMIQGTGSFVGKSVVTAALCRYFRQEGFRGAPFKAQNMSNNSYVTVDGGEMGRAQVFQAQACGIEPRVEMNPILLKASSEAGAQVVVLGKAVKTMSACQYHQYQSSLLGVIRDALEKLSQENDIIVIEGAGSPAEINLRPFDIVNMIVARMADAPVVLVGDINLGGVFAWLVGTLELLTIEHTHCSKRTAQLAILQACQQDFVVQDNGYYRLPAGLIISADFQRPGETEAGTAEVQPAEG